MRPHNGSKRTSEAGLILVETLVATAVLLVVAVGVMSLAAVAVSTTEDQGHLVARTTEYAQDKMEQLMALAYGDVTSNTAVFPTSNSGGTGLAVGGSSNPNAPVAGYVDYLDPNGNLLAGTGAPRGWFYKRAWQISTPAGTTNIKQITVTTIVAVSVGARGQLPQSTVICLKTLPF